MTYRVLASVSTRKNPKPESEDYNEFLTWSAGDEVESFPAWVSVRDLIESGHIERIDKADKKEGSQGG